MNRIFRIIILLVLIGAGLMYSLADRQPLKQQSDGVLSSGDERLFDGISSRALRAIDIRSAEQVLRFESTADGWQISNGQEVTAADPRAMTALLGAVENLRAVNRIASPDKLEEFGLQAPVVEVTVTSKRNSLTVNFGAEHVFSGRRYVQRRGEKEVLLIDKAYAKLFEKSFSELRKKSPFAFSADDVQSIAVHARDGEEYLLKRGQFARQWLVQIGELFLPAERDLVETRLTALTTLEGVEFLPLSEIERTGLRSPVVTLGVALSSGEETQVSFGEVPGEKTSEDLLPPLTFYVQPENGQVIYRINKRVHFDFLQSAFHFLDRTPLSNLAPESVGALCLKWGDGFKLGLLRDSDGTWRTGSSCLFDDKAKFTGKLSGTPGIVELLLNLNCLSYQGLMALSEEKFDSPGLRSVEILESRAGSGVRSIAVLSFVRESDKPALVQFNLKGLPALVGSISPETMKEIDGIVVSLR